MFWINFYHNVIWYSESAMKYYIADRVLTTIPGINIYKFYSTIK